MLQPPPYDEVIDAAIGPARAYLRSLPDRRVYPDTSPDEIRAVLDVPLQPAGEPAGRRWPAWPPSSSRS
jgi:hypothetical protein